MNEKVVVVQQRVNQTGLIVVAANTFARMHELVVVHLMFDLVIDSHFSIRILLDPLTGYPVDHKFWVELAMTLSVLFVHSQMMPFAALYLTENFERLRNSKL